jgi:hypothetical protein
LFSQDAVRLTLAAVRGRQVNNREDLQNFLIRFLSPGTAKV